MTLLVDVRLAQFGMGMQDGEIVRWLKRVGDTVAEGEVLAEVEAAKAVVEIVAPCGGEIVDICVGEGNTLAVLGTLARIRRS
jgi:pyruvate/2-oxoglutarate dehydrogenase complex dihydrolipoamide acyltransferase (E2) component